MFAALLVHSHAAETNVVKSGGVTNTNEWIFFKSYELHAYLLRAADLPPSEKEVIRRKAYQFFFEYWLAHRSTYASLQPLPDFERRFKFMLNKLVVPSLSADEQADPQRISALFKNGKRTAPLEMVLEPWALSKEEIGDWNRYQKIVKQYREFVSKEEPRSK